MGADVHGTNSATVYFGEIDDTLTSDAFGAADLTCDVLTFFTEGFSANHLSGDLSCCFIYDGVALTEGQLEAEWASLGTRVVTSGLYGNYPMVDAATAGNDTSGNDHHFETQGTLTDTTDPAPSSGDLIPGTAAAAGAATTTAALTAVRALTIGAVSGVATVAANLGEVGGLQQATATAVGVGTVSIALGAIRPASATAAGVATTSANLTATFTVVAGAAEVVVEGLANVQFFVGQTATAAGTLTVIADLQRIGLADRTAVATGVASVSATINALRPMQAISAGVSSVSAELGLEPDSAMPMQQRPASPRWLRC